jgi:nucleotide-binding universal stress UspA family protein
MLRKLFGTLAVAVVLCVGAVLADEIKGVLKKVDVDGHKITVTVDDKDTDYDVADDAKLPGGKNKPGTLKTLAKAVDKAGDKGIKVVITTDKDSKKVTEIKRDNAKAPDKDKTPPQ